MKIPYSNLRSTSTVLLFLALLTIASHTLAWGDTGHKTIGAIATKLIENTPAQKQLNKLLLPGETLAHISIWADCVKGYRCGPLTAEMTAYASTHPKHDTYHYTDVPFQYPAYHDGVTGSRDDDIVRTLQRAIAVLQRKSDAFTPRQALLLIAHLTGDIHQPLHVGAAYINKDGFFARPEKESHIDNVQIFNTHGGNRLLLPSLNGKPFHFYWDVTLVDETMRRLGVQSPEEFARTLLSRHPNLPAQIDKLTGNPNSWPYEWANEALALSKHLFANVTPGEMTEQTNRKGEAHPAWFITLPDDDASVSSAWAEQQIVKSGYHLAALLKAIWP